MMSANAATAAANDAGARTPTPRLASAADIEDFVDRLRAHFPRGVCEQFCDDLANELAAQGVTADQLERAAAYLIRSQRDVWFPRLARVLAAIAQSRPSPLIYIEAGSPAFAAWVEHLAERGDWLAAKARAAGCLLVPRLDPRSAGSHNRRNRR